MLRPGCGGFFMPLEWVKPIAWQIQRLRYGRAVEAAQDIHDILQQIRPYSAPVVSLMEPFEATIFEASNH